MQLNIRTSLTSVQSEPFGELHELVAKLLFYRDIKTKDDADVFINPNYDVHVHDPFLMKDMQKTVERIFDAMSRQQKIVIYGDYDADGIPASVILHDYFKKIEYKNFSVYIPHRDNEGFGLHIDAINTLHVEEAKLIITVDCGITNVKEVLHAQKLGIDVIITGNYTCNSRGC